MHSIANYWKYAMYIYVHVHILWNQFKHICPTDLIYLIREAIKESLPETYVEREREHLAQSAIIRRFDELVTRLVQREREMVQEQSRNRAEHEYIMYVMKNILPYVGLSLVCV